MTGDHDFNQVFFEDAFIPESMRVGEEGDGWMQVTTELAFERSGPERYLSSFPLVKEMVREAGQDPSERQAIGVGRMVARASTFREMSLSVSRYARGREKSQSGSGCDERARCWMGAKIPSMAHDLFGTSPRLGGASDYETTQAYITQANVSFRFAVARVKSCGHYCPWARYAMSELREILAKPLRACSPIFARKISWKSATAVNGRQIYGPWWKRMA